MKRYTFAIIFIVLGAAMLAQPICLAATATQDQGGDNSTLRGAFPTILVKGLDSKKLKDGDQVIVQITGPIRARNFMIPSGAKLYGHITQAQARSKGDSQSSLAMVFDKVETAKGHEMPFKGTLQAVAPPLPGSGGPDTSSMMGGGSMIAGHGGSDTMAGPGGVSPSGVHSSDANAGGSHPVLNNESQGVLGFKGIEMDKSGVLTSSGKELKLDNGTQMLIRAEIPIPVE